MGAKASTASGNNSPRSRTFSGSNDIGTTTNSNNASFNFLRAFPVDMATDRVRARSLSSVQNTGESSSAPIVAGTSQDHDSDSSSDGIESSSGSRINAAHSLPTQMFNFAGLKCPICRKFILPEETEYHLDWCLTKPRLSYNEDILLEDKGECVICLDDLSQGNVIARLPCLCIYHKTCIDRWFKVNRCCPGHPGF